MRKPKYKWKQETPNLFIANVGPLFVAVRRVNKGLSKGRWVGDSVFGNGITTEAYLQPEHAQVATERIATKTLLQLTAFLVRGR